MAGRVQGKVAFITGAARGQGRSHAVRLAEEGANIIGVDVCGGVETQDVYPPSTADDLEETAELVAKAGGRMLAVEADVRSQAALDEALRRGVGKFGRVDTVLANAGILTMGAAHEQSELQWQTMLDVNLSGVWRTAKAAIPFFIDQNSGGSIIITSSLAGLKTAVHASSYGASKWGLVGLARTLAHELAPYRVRVNTVHPRNVRTPMLDNAMVRKAFRPDLEAPNLDDVAAAYASINLWPMPFVESIDVSNAILWLASDEARYVTGISLPVDLGGAAK